MIALCSVNDEFWFEPPRSPSTYDPLSGHKAIHFI